MLKSICRELEVQLNDDDLVGKILRARLIAFHQHKSEIGLSGTMASHSQNTMGVRNMIIEAIRHIAAYGFFLRDMTDLQTTYQLECAIMLAQQGSLFSKFTNATLGATSFGGEGSRSGTTLGPGDTRLLWSSIYGRGHMSLNGSEAISNFKLNFSNDQLQNIRCKAQSLLYDDIHALYTVFEWTHLPNPAAASHGYENACTLLNCIQSMNDATHWRRISAITCLRSSFLCQQMLMMVRNHPSYSPYYLRVEMIFWFKLTKNTSILIA
jgi:hypothetical protein